MVDRRRTPALQFFPKFSRACRFYVRSISRALGSGIKCVRDLGEASSELSGGRTSPLREGFYVDALCSRHFRIARQNLEKRYTSPSVCRGFGKVKVEHNVARRSRRVHTSAIKSKDQNDQRPRHAANNFCAVEL